MLQELLFDILPLWLAGKWLEETASENDDIQCCEKVFVPLDLVMYKILVSNNNVIGLKKS